MNSFKESSFRKYFNNLSVNLESSKERCSVLLPKSPNKDILAFPRLISCFEFSSMSTKGWIAFHECR